MVADTEAKRRAIIQDGGRDYEKKRQMGRIRTSGVPQLGLEPGDRLDPSPGLPDVAAFSAAPLPMHVVFCRRPGKFGEARATSVITNPPEQEAREPELWYLHPCSNLVRQRVVGAQREEPSGLAVCVCARVASRRLQALGTPFA